MTKWDIGALRVNKTLGKFYLSGAACLLPATGKDDMIRFGKESFLRFKVYTQVIALFSAKFSWQISFLC